MVSLDGYAYLRVLQQFLDAPRSSNFVYLERTVGGSPYALEVADYQAGRELLTMSPAGILEVGQGDLTPLVDWQLEATQYAALQQLRLFGLQKVWKAFRIWVRAVRKVKRERACAALEKNLFVSNSGLRAMMQAVTDLAHQLSSLKLLMLPHTLPLPLQQFLEQQSTLGNAAKERLTAFRGAADSAVDAGCHELLQKLDEELADTHVAARDAAASTRATSASRTSLAQNRPTTFEHTRHAVRRAMILRLLDCIRVCDLMLCASLHQVLNASVNSLLQSLQQTRPSAEGRMAEALWRAEIVIDGNRFDSNTVRLGVDPSKAQLQASVKDLVAGWVALLASMPRLGLPRFMEPLIAALHGPSSVAHGKPLKELLLSEHIRSVGRQVEHELDWAFGHLDELLLELIPVVTAASSTNADEAAAVASGCQILRAFVVRPIYDSAAAPSFEDAAAALGVLRRALSSVRSQHTSVQMMVPIQAGVLIAGTSLLQGSLLPVTASKEEALHRELKSLALDAADCFSTAAVETTMRLTGTLPTMDEHASFVDVLKGRQERLKEQKDVIASLQTLITDFSIELSDHEAAKFMTVPLDLADLLHAIKACAE